MRRRSNERKLNVIAIRNFPTLLPPHNTALLTEIAGNDFNFTRYVDTFEPLEPVDMDAVARELKALDNELAANAKEVAKFCRELGIETPF